MTSLSRYLIGETLESFRKLKNLSPKELANGICTEEELISFEKEKAYPDLVTLNLLANRLNIDLDYFFTVASQSSINYTIAVIRIINKLKRDWHYEDIYNIVLKELENPIFKSNKLKQFLLWHQGICVFYVERDTQKALDLLNQAIDLTNPERTNLTEQEIDVLTSIAILYKETENHQKAITIFKMALKNLQSLPDLLEPRIQVKALFGLAQSLTELGQYEKSLEYCNQGIELCVNQELLYLLASLYYQAGENLIRMGKKEDGIQSIEHAINLLKIQDNKKFINIIETERDKLLQEC